MINFIITIFIIMFVLPAYADGINSFSISSSTLKAFPKCVHYKFPTHFCTWISHAGVLNVTPVLDHYLPDLIVIVFPKPGKNPWTEAKVLFDEVGGYAETKIINHKLNLKDGTGYGNHSFLDEHEQSISFKEAEVVGNPVLEILPTIFDFILLPSTATILKPYYQSMLDSILWRGLPPEGLLEETAAIGLALTHHIGNSIINWGPLYPHEGKVVGDNDVKISSVIAQRATDIVTNSQAFGHIHQKLSTSCGQHCKASPIEENSKETYFQMIYPITQNECFELGEDESYQPEMLNKEGSYIWVVWRHYEGCADGNGKYLWTT